MPRTPLSWRVPAEWLAEMDRAAEALGINRTAAVMMLARFGWRAISDMQPTQAREWLEAAVGERD